MNGARIAGLVPIICFYPVGPQQLLTVLLKLPFTSMRAFFNVVSQFLNIVLHYVKKIDSDRLKSNLTVLTVYDIFVIHANPCIQNQSLINKYAAVGLKQWNS